MAVSEGQRQGVLSIRLTPEQRERLDTLALSHGLKASELARNWIVEKLDGGGRSKVLETVTATRQELRKIGDGLSIILAAILANHLGIEEAQRVVDSALGEGRLKINVR